MEDVRSLPTSQGHCEGAAEAQVSPYFPMAYHMELTWSQVTHKYFFLQNATPGQDSRDAVLLEGYLLTKLLNKPFKSVLQM